MLPDEPAPSAVPEKLVPILAAEYLEHFKCIGPRCEDSCCAGWSCISVDTNTYVKSQLVQDPELSPMFAEKYVSGKTPNGETEYHIQLNEDSTCPFHSSERLCSIQVKLGPEYLSNTCQMYPRISNLVNGVIERSAVLSCPEIARLALLNPEGIAYTVQEVPSWSHSTPSQAVSDGGNKLESSLPDRMFDIRMLAIEILQDRTMPLAKRLLVLGQACASATSAMELNAVPMLQQIASAYRRESSTTPIPTVPLPELVYHAQLMLLLEILTGERFAQRGSKRFRECREEALAGIRFREGSSPKRIMRSYVRNYSHYYEPFMREHEYILENFLVNQVFKTIFPTRDSISIFDAYAALVLSYAIIKTLLVAISGHRKGLDTEIVVKLIQSYAKSFEHRSGGWSELVQELRARRRMNLDYMALLTGPMEPAKRRRFFR